MWGFFIIKPNFIRDVGVIANTDKKKKYYIYYKNSMNRLPLIFTISFIVFTNCEGVKFISGTVISADNGQAITHAEIYVMNNVGHSTGTDSLGRFTVKTGLTSMMFGGPKFKFEVRKDGYESQVVKTKFGVDTIKLVKK
jgi:hypothetical protein